MDQNQKENNDHHNSDDSSKEKFTKKRKSISNKIIENSLTKTHKNDSFEIQNQNKENYSISGKKVNCEIHENMKLKYLCLNQACTEQSRFLCKYCLKTHKDNEFFVDIKELENQQFWNIYNFPISIHQKAYQKIYRQCHNIDDDGSEGDNSNENQFRYLIEGVRTFFLNLQVEISDLINKQQKEIIINLEKEYNNSKFNKDTIQQELQKTFNLTSLRNILSEFATKQNTEKKTNSLLKDYLETQKKYEEESQVLQMVLRDSISIDLSTDRLTENLNKKKQQCMKSINTLLTTEVSLLKKNQIKFFAAEYQGSKQHISIKNNIIQFTNSGHMYKVLYSEVFQRNQEIQLRFKLDCDGTFESDFFVVGVVMDGKEENGHNYGPDGGNYFMLNGHDGHTSDKPSLLIGENLKDIYKDGMEIMIDICVEENKFEMYDVERKSIRRNTHEFKNNKDWRFIVSAPRAITPTFTFF